MRFLFAVINFLLLAAIVYFLGGKTISGIFKNRMEKINKDLDETDVPVPDYSDYAVLPPEEAYRNPELEEEKGQ